MKTAFSTIACNADCVKCNFKTRKPSEKRAFVEIRTTLTFV
jgi:hypothetical protein